jgi:glycine amidinotransferase
MPTKPTTCPVNSHNEWDPLEEVIVGRLEFAIFPAWDMINLFTMPPGEWEVYADHVAGKAGNPYRLEIVQAAQKNLDEFIRILKSEGIIVRRHDLVQHYALPFSTPAWRVDSGFCSANPRDVFLVIGNEIIETPMADRARYFESWAYRSLFIEYFKAGARWTAAPKPMLTDAVGVRNLFRCRLPLEYGIDSVHCYGINSVLQNQTESIPYSNIVEFQNKVYGRQYDSFTGYIIIQRQFGCSLHC